MSVVQDSKKLSEKKRADLLPQIIEKSVEYEINMNYIGNMDLKNNGYLTKIHMESLREFGPIDGFHRYSYQPVKDGIK